MHCVTRKTVAVKMINREKLSKSVLLKVGCTMVVLYEGGLGFEVAAWRAGEGS